jgi:hypothetical protein
MMKLAESGVRAAFTPIASAIGERLASVGSVGNRGDRRPSTSRGWRERGRPAAAALASGSGRPDLPVARRPARGGPRATTYPG